MYSYKDTKSEISYTPILFLPIEQDLNGYVLITKVWFDRTVFYGEYGCMGPGADTSRRAKYSKKLNFNGAIPFASLNFIGASTWLLPPPNLSLN